MAAQTFPRFADLPRELRDEIWRRCLPHRIVELDLPDQQYLEWCFEDRYCQSFAGLDHKLQHPCDWWQTSWRNRAPPTITRVCRESRMVAFKSANLTLLSNRTSPMPVITNDSCSWADLSRDTVHLHWHTCLSEPMNAPGTSPLQLRLGLSSQFQNASICADLLDSVYRRVRREIMDCLERRSSWSVCGAYVCIHTSDEAAVTKSDLWGSLGEERVVLVDARDTKRVASFRNFWKTHGTKEDVKAKAFFEACVDDVPKIHYLETPMEFLQDLEIRWLHDHLFYEEENTNAQDVHRQVWLMTPGDFDGKEDDPRQADYGQLPGRPFARQLWSPNRNHPRVQDILARMPDLQPTIMFRLCINNCLAERLDIDGDNNALGSNRDVVADTSKFPLLVGG